jgi:hypothetical protein
VAAGWINQHDMMLWDHGLPRADDTVSAEQRVEADINIEFQSTSKLAFGVSVDLSLTKLHQKFIKPLGKRLGKLILRPDRFPNLLMDGAEAASSAALPLYSMGGARQDRAPRDYSRVQRINVRAERWSPDRR